MKLSFTGGTESPGLSLRVLSVSFTVSSKVVVSGGLVFSIKMPAVGRWLGFIGLAALQYLSNSSILPDYRVIYIKG